MQRLKQRLKQILTVIGLAIGLVISSQPVAAQYILKDEIRGGIKLLSITAEPPNINGAMLFFFNENIVEFRFLFEERVSNNRQVFRWPKLTSPYFSIRFNANLDKLKNLDPSTSSYWSDCIDPRCSTGRHVVLENTKGTMVKSTQPDGSIRSTLVLAMSPFDFNWYYNMYKGSKKIVIEVEGVQYVFKIKSY